MSSSLLETIWRSLVSAADRQKQAAARTFKPASGMDRPGKPAKQWVKAADYFATKREIESGDPSSFPNNKKEKVEADPDTIRARMAEKGMWKRPERREPNILPAEAPLPKIKAPRKSRAKPKPVVESGTDVLVRATDRKRILSTKPDGTKMWKNVRKEIKGNDAGGHLSKMTEQLVEAKKISKHMEKVGRTWQQLRKQGHEVKWMSSTKGVRPLKTTVVHIGPDGKRVKTDVIGHKD